MKFEALLSLVRHLPCFDLHLLAQADERGRETLRIQLGRWMKAGKLIGLRRGIYTLAEIYRAAPVNPAALAHLLYSPSYLSGEWALASYDLIPERVVRLTSVTPRVPRVFDNPLGVFEYRNIKQTAFFGYREERAAGVPLLIAEPEKALLDHWHLSSSEWTSERLAEMRYQNHELIDRKRLLAYALRFGNPRLVRAAKRWIDLTAAHDDGEVII